jgi:deazaflavin-dependent oxidoreductase (nitroreductase family)
MSELPRKPKKSMVDQKPRGLLRFGFRLPIWLYRLHLGWLLGDRFLLLTHTGRKSGLPHQTVIEVIRHDKVDDTCLVASGWGTRSDWFRNIQKTPGVTITLGSRKWTTRALILSENEGALELLDYARRHPHAFREISSLLAGHSLAGTEENCRDLAKAVPIVAFHPTGISRVG